MPDTQTLLIGVNDIFFYTKIRDAYRPQGYVLERARRQEDFVEKATAISPLAVILDMNDDRFDATAALQALKGHDHLKDLPILAFANHEEVETWRQARALGIQKIVSRNEFSARALALLEEVISPTTATS